MQERKPEIQPTKISRERFLKITAVGVGTALVGYEAFKAKEGVITPQGTFVPLYEAHEIGIPLEQIPDNLDVYFREITIEGGLFKGTPKERLQDIRISRWGKKIDSFPELILNDLARKKTELMIGDVQPPDPIDLATQKRIALFSFEAILGGLAAASLRLQKESSNFPRRRFLQKAVAIGVSLWGIPPFWLSGASPIFMNTPPNKQPWETIKRIYSRVWGIQSHFHPEDLDHFFRDVMMADKMLCVAERIKQKTGGKPRVAFQVQGGHAGIEDFLQAGRNICRILVLAYPSCFLRRWVDANNGPEDFCSARLFKLPENFPTAGDEKWERITERRVTDQKLLQTLKKRL